MRLYHGDATPRFSACHCMIALELPHTATPVYAVDYFFTSQPRDFNAVAIGLTCWRLLLATIIVDIVI